MYSIYMDGSPIWLAGNDGTNLDKYHVDDPVLSLELNTAGNLSFTIPPANDSYNKIQKLKSVISVYRDDKEIWRGRVTETTKDFWNCKQVECEGELAFLNDYMQRPFEYRGTIKGYLEYLIGNYNSMVDDFKKFTVGEVTVLDSNDYLYRHKESISSTWDCIKTQLLETHGGYIKTREEDGVHYIDYLIDSGTVSSQIISFGNNLLDLEEYIDATDLYTVIIPMGAVDQTTGKKIDIKSVNDDKDYLASAQGVELYGWIERVVEWSDVTTAQNLKIKAQAELSKAIQEATNLTIDAVDLSLAGYDVDVFRLGDKIRCTSAPHNIDTYFTLSKETIPLADAGGERYTLGIVVKGLTGQLLDTILQVDSETSAFLQEAITTATEIIKANTEGYVYLVKDETTGHPRELCIMDSPSLDSAEKLWRWNANGLGYSSTGYNGEYTTAWTMDGGFNADFINTGTLKGVTLISENPSTGHSVEMSQGIIKVKNRYGHEIGKITKNSINEETGYEGTMGVLAGVYGEEVVIGSSYVDEDGNTRNSAPYHQVNRGFSPSWAKGYRHLFTGDIFSGNKLDFGVVEDGECTDVVGGVTRSANNHMIVCSYNENPLLLGYTKSNEPNTTQPLLQFKPSEDLYPRWGASTWSGTIPISGLNLTFKNGLLTGVSGAFSLGGITGGHDILSSNGVDWYTLYFENGICKTFWAT